MRVAFEVVIASGDVGTFFSINGRWADDVRFEPQPKETI
jgi:hypothetical protein